MIKNYQKDGLDLSLAKNSDSLQSNSALKENDRGLWSCGLCKVNLRILFQLLSAGLKNIPQYKWH